MNQATESFPGRGGVAYMAGKLPLIFIPSAIVTPTNANTVVSGAMLIAYYLLDNEAIIRQF